MKTTLNVVSHIMLSAATLLLTATLSACGDDDELDPTPHDYGTLSVPKEFHVTYSARVKDTSMFNVADLVVKYIDNDGSVKTEAVDAASWAKDVKFVVGANTLIGLRSEWHLKSKPVIEAHTNERFDMTVNLTSLYDVFFQDGTSRTSMFEGYSSDQTPIFLVNTDYLIENYDRPHFTQYCFKYSVTEAGFSQSTEPFPSED